MTTQSSKPPVQNQDQVMFMLAPLAMLRNDKLGAITIANQAAEELFQYQSEEWLSLTMNEISNGDFDYGDLNSPVTSESFEQRVSLRRKDGSYFWAETRSRVVETLGEVYFLTAIIDVTERELQKQELEVFTKKLKKSNEELDNFAYVASHDLKAPLRAIDNLASWIEEDIDDKNAVKKHIAMLSARSQRMGQLLEDLLQYSRIGRDQSKFQDIDCNIMVRDLFELSTPPDGFSLNIEGELPTFNTLIAPFEQVVRNIISNAIKHHDQQTGEIRVSCIDLPSTLEFIITDDGPGIEAKYHEKIFAMFQTLQARDETEGSGMGLAMVKKIVETYDGSISLISAPGEGTTFQITWPKIIRI